MCIDFLWQLEVKVRMTKKKQPHTPGMCSDLIIEQRVFHINIIVNIYTGFVFVLFF